MGNESSKKAGGSSAAAKQSTTTTSKANTSASSRASALDHIPIKIDGVLRASSVYPLTSTALREAETPKWIELLRQYDLVIRQNPGRSVVELFALLKCILTIDIERYRVRSQPARIGSFDIETIITVSGLFEQSAISSDVANSESDAILKVVNFIDNLKNIIAQIKSYLFSGNLTSEGIVSLLRVQYPTMITLKCIGSGASGYQVTITLTNMITYAEVGIHVANIEKTVSQKAFVFLCKIGQIDPTPILSAQFASATRLTPTQVGNQNVNSSSVPTGVNLGHGISRPVNGEATRGTNPGPTLTVNSSPNRVANLGPTLPVNRAAHFGATLGAANLSSSPGSIPVARSFNEEQYIKRRFAKASKSAQQESPKPENESHVSIVAKWTAFTELLSSVLTQGMNVHKYKTRWDVVNQLRNKGLRILIQDCPLLSSNAADTGKNHCATLEVKDIAQFTERGTDKTHSRNEVARKAVMFMNDWLKLLKQFRYTYSPTKPPSTLVNELKLGKDDLIKVVHESEGDNKSTTTIEIVKVVWFKESGVNKRTSQHLAAVKFVEFLKQITKIDDQATTGLIKSEAVVKSNNHTKNKASGKQETRVGDQVPMLSVASLNNDNVANDMNIATKQVTTEKPLNQSTQGPTLTPILEPISTDQTANSSSSIVQPETNDNQSNPPHGYNVKWIAHFKSTECKGKTNVEILDSFVRTFPNDLWFAEKPKGAKCVDIILSNGQRCIGKNMNSASKKFVNYIETTAQEQQCGRLQQLIECYEEVKSPQKSKHQVLVDLKSKCPYISFNRIPLNRDAAYVVYIAIQVKLGDVVEFVSSEQHVRQGWDRDALDKTIVFLHNASKLIENFKKVYQPNKQPKVVIDELIAKSPKHYIKFKSTALPGKKNAYRVVLEIEDVIRFERIEEGRMGEFDFVIFKKAVAWLMALAKVEGVVDNHQKVVQNQAAESNAQSILSSQPIQKYSTTISPPLSSASSSLASSMTNLSISSKKSSNQKTVPTAQAHLAPQSTNVDDDMMIQKRIKLIEDYEKLFKLKLNRNHLIEQLKATHKENPISITFHMNISRRSNPTHTTTIKIGDVASFSATEANQLASRNAAYYKMIGYLQNLSNLIKNTKSVFSLSKSYQLMIEQLIPRNYQMINMSINKNNIKQTRVELIQMKVFTSPGQSIACRDAITYLKKLAQIEKIVAHKVVPLTIANGGLSSSESSAGINNQRESKSSEVKPEEVHPLVCTEKVSNSESAESGNNSLGTNSLGTSLTESQIVVSSPEPGSSQVPEITLPVNQEPKELKPNTRVLHLIKLIENFRSVYIMGMDGWELLDQLKREKGEEITPKFDSVGTDNFTLTINIKSIASFTSTGKTQQQVKEEALWKTKRFLKNLSHLANNFKIEYAKSHDPVNVIQKLVAYNKEMIKFTCSEPDKDGNFTAKLALVNMDNYEKVGKSKEGVERAVAQKAFNYLKMLSFGVKASKSAQGKQKSTTQATTSELKQEEGPKPETKVRNEEKAKENGDSLEWTTALTHPLAAAEPTLEEVLSQPNTISEQELPLDNQEVLSSETPMPLQDAVQSNSVSEAIKNDITDSESLQCLIDCFKTVNSFQTSASDLLNILEARCPNAIKSSFSKSGPEHKPEHQAEVILTEGGTWFQFASKRKVDARARVAQQVIDHLKHQLTNVQKSVPIRDKLELTLSNYEAKKIYNEVLAQWKAIPKQNHGYKVMAAFVLTRVRNSSDVRVVSIGTGSKCIFADSMSLTGSSVHDCHAEVIARRAFRCLLYENLQHLTSDQWAGSEETEKNLILEPVAIDGGGTKYRLKPELKLNLFITSSPCGASFQCLNDVLRVKLEAVAGYQEMPVDYISTWQSLQNGKQSATFMTCSDKIAMWNVVGVQGALLAQFIEPIYLHSIIVTDYFPTESMSRALYERVDSSLLASKMVDLERHGFRLNRHAIKSYRPEGHDKQFDCSLAKRHGHSHNWYRPLDSSAKPKLEVINSRTGNIYNEDSQPSRLSKQSLLKRYNQLTLNNPVLCAGFISEDGCGSMDAGHQLMQERLKRTYRGLKQKSSQYQRAKLALIETLKESNLGQWVQAPLHVDLFEVE